VHTIKAHMCSTGQVPQIPNWALDGGEWSASRYREKTSSHCT